MEADAILLYLPAEKDDWHERKRRFTLLTDDRSRGRRTCLGSSVGNPNRQGEEVCNIDGKLGLVLPMPDSDWLLRLSTPLKQYPANLCTGAFFPGKAPTVFTCAPRNTKHSGECPNGDQLNGPLCMTPIDDSVTPATSQCLASNSSIPVV